MIYSIHNIFTWDLAKNLSDQVIFTKTFAIHKFVKSLLLVADFDLWKDGFYRHIVRTVGRVEDRDDIELFIFGHHVFCLMDSQVVDKKVDLVISSFLAKFCQPTHILFGVNGLLSDFEVLDFAISWDASQRWPVDFFHIIQVDIDVLALFGVGQPWQSRFGEDSLVSKADFFAKLEGLLKFLPCSICHLNSFFLFALWKLFYFLDDFIGDAILFEEPMQKLRGDMLIRKLAMEEFAAIF